LRDLVEGQRDPQGHPLEISATSRVVDRSNLSGVVNGPVGQRFTVAATKQRDRLRSVPHQLL
jgi:hypothetical protein